MSLDPRSLSMSPDHPGVIVDVDGATQIECNNVELCEVVLAAIQMHDDHRRCRAALEKLVAELRGSNIGRNMGHAGNVALSVAERALRQKA